MIGVHAVLTRHRMHRLDRPTGTLIRRGADPRAVPLDDSELAHIDENGATARIPVNDAIRTRRMQRRAELLNP